MFPQDDEVFNILLNAVSEGVLIVDEHQIIMEANESAKTLFGYGEKELLGKNLNILVPKQYRSNHGEHFEFFLKNHKKRQIGAGRNIYGERKDGSVFPAEIGLNTFSIYDKNFVMALIIDISARKGQEHKMQEFTSQLEKKIAKRTKRLNTTIKELKLVNLKLDEENKMRTDAQEKTKLALQKEKELNELKTKFLSLVSHEFKTPLSSILTSAILLGKYQLNEQQQKRDKHIKTITDEVHYLNNILNDFLSVEKLETGKVKYKYSNFKLSKVVNEAVYNSNMLLKEGQKIIYPENIDDYSLVQDEKILELALSNLIHNAIKYSPENTTIQVEAMQDKVNTTLRIIDYGKGIPENDQKNIFTPYFRAENVLNTQGTGIGLSIAKSHLENLGGTITFTSKENIGSTFILNIPNSGNYEKDIIN